MNTGGKIDREHINIFTRERYNDLPGLGLSFASYVAAMHEGILLGVATLDLTDIGRVIG